MQALHHQQKLASACLNCQSLAVADQMGDGTAVVVEAQAVALDVAAAVGIRKVSASAWSDSLLALRVVRHERWRAHVVTLV